MFTDGELDEKVVCRDFRHTAKDGRTYPILLDKGKVSALEAKIKAESEYEKYRIVQDKNYISDFDSEIKRITGKKDER